VDWEIFLLPFIGIIGVVALNSYERNRKITVTVKLLIKSLEKNEHGISEKEAVFKKQCLLTFLSQVGMEFAILGIGSAPISKVVASETYYPKIECGLSLSISSGTFEEAFETLKDEKWSVKTLE
jgi:hypothetical protein